MLMPRQRIQIVRPNKMVIMDIQEIQNKRPHDVKLKASALVPMGKFLLTIIRTRCNTI